MGFLRTVLVLAAVLCCEGSRIRPLAPQDNATWANKLSFERLDVEEDPSHGRPVPRSSHGLSLVNKGRRLVLYGGEHVARTPVDSDQALWFAELRSKWWAPWQPAVWRWHRVLAARQPPPRVAHAQAAVDDRFVYIFGGRAGIEMQEEALNDLWRLDTFSLEWTKVEASPDGSPPPEARSFHRMVAIGRSLYVFGGCGEKHARLADLHRFDIDTATWHDLGSSLLRGRGGANLLVLANGKQLAIVAGFAGEETADGQVFDIATNEWRPTLLGELGGLRPRSVCASGCFQSRGVCVLFGGEVDPSGRGHEGAGDFADDIVLFDIETGRYLGSIGASSSVDWPPARGWADAAVRDSGNALGWGSAQMYIFGGLSGDDKNPIRRDDLWRLDVGQPR